jgi:hypothetical protein
LLENVHFANVYSFRDAVKTPICHRIGRTQAEDRERGTTAPIFVPVAIGATAAPVVVDGGAIAAPVVVDGGTRDTK